VGSSRGGLSSAEARQRLAEAGPNALRNHRALPLTVLARQFKHPLLLLLLLAAAVRSAFVGEATEALIISVICGQRRARLRERVPLGALWRRCTRGFGISPSRCGTASRRRSTWRTWFPAT
jgi:hypothetical protein